VDEETDSEIVFALEQNSFRSAGSNLLKTMVDEELRESLQWAESVQLLKHLLRSASRRISFDRCPN
jgi:hypothetical protein